MIWLRHIRGHKVICNNKCIGSAIQGALSNDFTALDGIWIDRALLGLRFIAAEHICVIGTDSIIVDHVGERMRLKPQNLFIRAVTTDGRKAGAVTDAAIDSQTLAVIALRLIPDWLSDLTDKYQLVNLYKFDPASSRVIIIKERSESEV